MSKLYHKHRYHATQCIDHVTVSTNSGAILLVILAAVDAAYSGDWSRIGAISKDTELWLQSAVRTLGIWHLANGIAAYIIADQNGWPKLLATDPRHLLHTLRLPC